jgi:hypothetical protein
MISKRAGQQHRAFKRQLRTDELFDLLVGRHAPGFVIEQRSRAARKEIDTIGVRAR